MLRKNRMLTCKKFHVNMKVTMSTCMSFHANMHFFLNMHVWKKMHVDIDCKNFMSNDALVCGEKFYSMATSIPTLTEVSFLENFLTICIACLVSPHLMYHMFNLYRGLPFPSPVLDSETAPGF